MFTAVVSCTAKSGGENLASRAGRKMPLDLNFTNFDRVEGPCEGDAKAMRKRSEGSSSMSSPVPQRLGLIGRYNKASTGVTEEKLQKKTIVTALNMVAPLQGYCCCLYQYTRACRPSSDAVLATMTSRTSLLTIVIPV